MFTIMVCRLRTRLGMSSSLTPCPPAGAVARMCSSRTLRMMTLWRGWPMLQTAARTPPLWPFEEAEEEETRKTLDTSLNVVCICCSVSDC